MEDTPKLVEARAHDATNMQIVQIMHSLDGFLIVGCGAWHVALLSTVLQQGCCDVRMLAAAGKVQGCSALLQATKQARDTCE
jgi:hypothetical protein